MQRLAGGRCGGRAPGACRSSHVPVLVAMGCAGCGRPGSRLHTCPRRGRDHRCIRLARGDVSHDDRGVDPDARAVRLRPSPGRAHQPAGRAGVASKAKLAEAAAGMPLLRAHETKDVEWRALRSEHACEGTRRASRRRDPGMGGVLCSLRRTMTPPICEEPKKESPACAGLSVRSGIAQPLDRYLAIRASQPATEGCSAVRPRCEG